MSLPTGSPSGMGQKDPQTPIAASGVIVHHLGGFGVGIRFSEHSTRTRRQISKLLEHMKRLNRKSA